MIRGRTSSGTISLTRGIIVLSFALALARVCAGSRAQQDPSAASNQEKVDKLLNKSSFEDLLSGNPGAVANAKEIFSLTSDPKLKQRAASILLSIRKADQVHFDYLTAEAEKALNDVDAMPWPTLYDKDGNIVPDSLNPDFRKWCDVHQVKYLDTFEAAYYEVPAPWYHLAAAGDPRAFDLLIKGLHSKNVMISGLAAEGLAKLQDARAIDEIIAAYHRAPVESRDVIARALLFFPDSRAQSAADRFIKNKEALEIWRKEAESKGPKALFGY